MNPPVAQTHIRFVNAGMIDDQRIRNNSIDSPFSTGRLRLSHAVTNNFSTAKFDLFAVGHRVGTVCAFSCEIALDFDDKLSICEANFVANGGTEHGCIIRAAY